MLLACTPGGGDDAGCSGTAASSTTPTSSADTGEPAPYVPVEGNTFPWAQESDVVVIFEPSRGLSPNEQDALVNYMLAGGGLLAVANHVGADRDGNGFSAPEVWNDLIGSDGSDSHGNQLGDHDAWNDPTQDNAKLLLDAVAWLGAK